MRPEPPKSLEAVVALLIPPACREEVLGDLCERHSTRVRHMILALRTVPFVIASRIRRTTDAQVLLMEALLLYASFLTAALFTDRSLLSSQWGMLRLAVPVAVTLSVVVLGDAWARSKRTPLNLIREVAIGLGLGRLCLGILPPLMTLSGACAALVSVSTVRILFRPGTGSHQTATGPASWAEPQDLSKTTKSLLAAAAVIILAAVVMVFLGLRPGFVGVVVALVALWFSRAGKGMIR